VPQKKKRKKKKKKRLGECAMVKKKKPGPGAKRKTKKPWINKKREKKKREKGGPPTGPAALGKKGSAVGYLSAVPGDGVSKTTNEIKKKEKEKS